MREDELERISGQTELGTQACPSSACRTLLEKIEETTGEASMIDVQTLIYVADDA